MSVSGEKSKSKKNEESELVEMFRKREYSLNTVNNYGDNLLHISAASGCLEILKEILSKHGNCNIDRKNKMGWTPLMLAIRNGNIETAKLLLDYGANAKESTYLGMSAFALAAAISEEMLDTIYKACPSVLEHTANDDITPLCVVAMKNDRKLFFKLIDLGLKVCEANVYTHLMMKQSSVPEIVAFAEEHLDIEDYWDDKSDNIEVREDSDIETIEVPPLSSTINDQNIEHGLRMVVDCGEPSEDNSKEGVTRLFAQQPNIQIKHVSLITQQMKKTEKRHNSNKINLPKLDLLSITENLSLEQSSLISPNLTYNMDSEFSISPNLCYLKNEFWPTTKETSRDGVANKPSSPDERKDTDSSVSVALKASLPPAPPLQRLQAVRPPDLEISDHSDVHNTSLGFVPEFSPSRSPHIPPDVSDDDSVFGENTPTPPHCKTPPQGMTLNPHQAELALVLKQFDLVHHLPIFVEQEVDLELFWTLNEQDMEEIGIKSNVDRKALLRVINEYKNNGL